MTNPARITVYIPSREYGAFLEAAIESVMRQSVGDWELLLFNDGAADATAEVMEKYRSDPRVRIFETGGVGLAAVANKAIEEARGRYIIRLDGDDVFDENILLVLANYLDRNPGDALVFPDYYLMDRDGRIFAQERHEPSLWNRQNLTMPPNGACTMVRTSVLREIGGYRTDLGAQDGFDIWARIARNYSMGQVNVPLFYYRRHGENLTENQERIFVARRRVKALAANPELESNRPLTAVIPCRSRYDFHPDVWKLDFGGRTLLANTLTTCLSSKLFDHVVVTSDTEEVKREMEAFSDPRLKFIPRPEEETIRSRPLGITLNRVARELSLPPQGLTVMAYVQAPFTKTATLEEALYTLVLSGQDSAMAVVAMDTPLFRPSRHGLLPLNAQEFLRHDFDRIYREANTAVAARNRNFTGGALLGPSVSHFAIAEEECFFISSRQNYDIAKVLFQNRISTK